jgi:hydrogenase expression/formation protein HypD
MNNHSLMLNLLNAIKSLSIHEFRIMEVCGTHTQAISKLGLRELLPQITFLSGPGCPVCVTPEGYIDAAVELLNTHDVLITTFGDLMKVNGTNESLITQREKGKKIKVVYSPLDALEIAKENPNSEIVFLAVGFETTAPLIALAVKKAKGNNIKNISFLCGLKCMQPILHKILKNKTHKIDGIICPGHVAAVKGSDYFKFITKDYNIPSAVAGFEALDIVGAVYYLLIQQKFREKGYINLYRRCVTKEGNINANLMLNEVFNSSDSVWRGIGKIDDSAFSIKEEYAAYDAFKKFNISLNEKSSSTNCICSEIIMGRRLPNECKFFGTRCTPENAYGPCMVSSEGACSVFYKYHRRIKNE